jgi:hypothetical protein
MGSSARSQIGGAAEQYGRGAKEAESKTTMS